MQGGRGSKFLSIIHLSYVMPVEGRKNTEENKEGNCAINERRYEERMRGNKREKENHREGKEKFE